MKENVKSAPKFKHIREKSYLASHPLYDLMGEICNPENEICGHTTDYNGLTFRLDACIDTYYDEHGIPKRRVSVQGLNQQEDRWTVYETNAEELAEEKKKLEKQEFNPHTVYYTYEDGHVSWIERCDYNGRRELIHMEQAFYGDGILDDFQDTPIYTLISELTYEYDDYGNWTLCYLHCKEGLHPDELTIKEIEYQ